MSTLESQHEQRIVTSISTSAHGAFLTHYDLRKLHLSCKRFIDGVKERLDLDKSGAGKG